jgi:hypothetical protein
VEMIGVHSVPVFVHSVPVSVHSVPVSVHSVPAPLRELVDFAGEKRGPEKAKEVLRLLKRGAGVYSKPAPLNTTTMVMVTTPDKNRIEDEQQRTAPDKKNQGNR